MNTKKPTGNRWATAVEGAADVLLDAGKSNGLVHSVPLTDVQPQNLIVPVSVSQKKPTKKVPSEKKASMSETSQTKTLHTPSSKNPLSEAKAVSPPLPIMIEESNTATLSPTERMLESISDKPFDPIEQALTMKGRKSSGGRQRTYYVDNDIADKISSLAKNLDKSESQLLREVLRAVFKMND